MDAIYARPLTEIDRQALQEGLKSKSALTVRRCQMILMSADEHRGVNDIGERVGRTGQTVRETLRAFNQEGMRCIHPRPMGRPDEQRAFDEAAREQLRDMIHRSPREYGYETSLWTLKLIAQASYEHGLTPTQVHFDTISQTLAQMGLGWKRAKKHIQSPDEHYDAKKTTRLVENRGEPPPRLALI